jgi:hypothetical protein
MAAEKIDMNAQPISQQVEKKKSEKVTKERKKRAVSKKTQKSEDCPICCSEYTATLKKKVECNFCNKEACLACVKRYILSSFDDVHCMFCKTRWSYTFMDSVLSKYFRLRQYKAHRENVLCERERIRIPETQALYETVMERQENLLADIQGANELAEHLGQELANITAKYREEIANLDIIVRQRKHQMARLNSVLNGVTNTVEDDATFADDAISRGTGLQVACPKDGCGGLISDKAKCGICGTRVCERCQEVQTTDEASHQCNEDTVQTVKKLRNDCKNCPGCGVPIYKIDGCEQMWCVKCHTAFAWSTGLKVTHGRIHNPHFYEWKRQNGGLAPGAVDADGCPVGLVPIDALERNLKTLTGNDRMTRVLYNLHREVTHIDDLELGEERRVVDPNRMLRLTFMKGTIKEEDWKKELHRRETMQLRKTETREILAMYVATVSDIFREISTCTSKEELRTLQEKLVSLLEYVNKSLTEVNEKYGSSAMPQWAHPMMTEKIRRLEGFVYKPVVMSN